MIENDKTGFPLIEKLGDACCGCGACAAKCPKDCIQMAPDDSGFRVPRVDTSQCVKCGACNKVCPVINLRKQDECRRAFCAKAIDDCLLERASSGGIFGLLADKTLRKGGIVIGVAWSSGYRGLHHVVIDCVDQLPLVSRSKYLQSSIDKEVYRQIKLALKAHRMVLFSGTACQVAGVKNYLGDFANSEELLCVEVVCHGVPSPLLWNRWLHYLEQKHESRIVGVNFRSKRTGWSTYSVAYDFEVKKDKREETLMVNHDDDWYMQAFLSDMSIRTSCYQCPSKRSSGGDITLGDYWGIAERHPEVNASMGVSAVLCNTMKGIRAFNEITEAIDYDESSFEGIALGNPSLVKSVSCPSRRNAFMDDLVNNTPISQMTRRWVFKSSNLLSFLKKLINYRNKLAK